jgi:hypothetical protein
VGEILPLAQLKAARVVDSSERRKQRPVGAVRAVVAPAAPAKDPAVVNSDGGAGEAEVGTIRSRDEVKERPANSHTCAALARTEEEVALAAACGAKRDDGHVAAAHGRLGEARHVAGLSHARVEDGASMDAPHHGVKCAHPPHPATRCRRRGRIERICGGIGDLQRCSASLSQTHTAVVKSTLKWERRSRDGDRAHR